MSLSMKACFMQQVALGLLTPAQQAKLLGRYNTAESGYLNKGYSQVEAAARAAEDILNEQTLLNNLQRTHQIQYHKAEMIKQEVEDLYQKALQAWNRHPKIGKKLAGPAPTRAVIYRNYLEKAQIASRRSTLEFEMILANEMDSLGLATVKKVTNDPNRMKEALKVILGETTPDVEAAQVGRAFRKTMDAQHSEFMKVGGIIGKIQNYAPQGHTAQKFIDQGIDSFKTAGLNKFDWTKIVNRKTGKPMQAGPVPTTSELADIDGYLTYMFHNVATDGNYGAMKKAEVGERVQSKVRKDLFHHQGREIHFKSPDDFLAYNEDFGWGNDNLLNMLMSDIQGHGSDIGIMQTLGPATHQTHEIMRGLFGLEDGPFGQRLTDAMFNTMTRNYAYGGSSRAHSATTVTHSIARGALLGFAPLASIGDVVLPATVATMQGFRNPLEQSLRMVQNTFTSDLATGSKAAFVPGKNAHQIIDQFIVSMGAAARYGGEALTGAESKMVQGVSRTSDTFLRMSGLQKMTTAIEDTGSHMLSGEVGYRVTAGHQWADLEPEFRATAAKYGINKSDWDAVLQMPVVPSQNGGQFLMWTDMMAHDQTIARKFGNWDIAMRQLVSNSPDLRLRAVSTGAVLGGGAMGSIERMSMSSLMVFKSFPTMFFRNFTIPLTRLAADGRIAPLAFTVTSLFGMGMLSTQLYNIFKGRGLEDPTTTDFYKESLARSGILGLIGDVFIREKEYGDSTIKDLAGPIGGMVEDVTLLASLGLGDLSNLIEGGREDYKSPAQLAKTASKYLLPNTWYLHAVIDRVVSDTMLEMVDPNFHEKAYERRRKLWTERGNTEWWRHGELTPEFMQ